MLTKEALEKIEDLCKGLARPHTILHASANEQHILIHGDDGADQVIKVPNDDFRRQHTFATLTGLIDYLNGPHCAATKDGIVFVNRKHGVTAMLNYGYPGDPHTATMPLNDSPELNAMLPLEEGVGIQRLRNILLTQLDGCFDDDLLTKVLGLKVSETTKNEVEIDDVGLGSSKGERTIELTYKPRADADKEHCKLKTEWTFTVPIFQCLERTYAIRTALTATTNPLELEFSPIRLDAIIDQALNDLVTELRQKVEHNRFTVNEGTNT